MSRVISFLLLFFIGHTSWGQVNYFPPIGSSSWDTLSPSSLGWCPERVDSLVNYVQGVNTKAFIVLKDGKIVIEKYFNGHDDQASWYWASAGKTLTALTTGIAQEEGFLSISDRTSDYLGSGWTTSAPIQENQITIKDQLSMTSGLDDGTGDPYCTDDTCLVYKADAGTRWAYHNGPYTLLQDVIASATNQTFSSYFNSKIRNPIGMRGLWIPSGYNSLYWSTARSMARFGLLIQNKGVWDGTTILTDTTYFNDMINTSQSLNESYGYLWWLNGKPSFLVPTSQIKFTGSLIANAPPDLIAALGKNDQKIHIVPSQGLTIIRMGDAAGSVFLTSSTFDNKLWSYMNALTQCITPTFDIENSVSFSIYPNPIEKGKIFEIQSDEPVEKIELFGVAGKLQNLIYATNRLETAEINRGIYFVRVTTKNNQGYQKVIIQ